VNHTLPDFLQTAGYSTYYTGKLMNGHTVENCERLPVSGFNSSDFLVDPYTYDYWNPAFSRDNGPAIIHPNTYSTDLVKEKALDYLEEASQSDQPFFLTVAPIGPHSWIASDGRDPDINHIHMEIPAAAPRHASLFPAEQIPRTESFNPDRAGGVSWVKHLPKAVSLIKVGRSQ
jgi:N-acetylglucosamine-6-sulfatase